MNYQVSLCYHPTTIVLVDDNQDFINVIKLQLEKNFYCKFYNDPLKALKLFREENQIKSFTQRCFVQPIDEQSDHLFFNVDLRQIYKETLIPERFEQIAVAIIDYTMPNMNGLELSKQLRAINPAIRILLLTGEADHELAVQAFNEGIIDKFIKKGSPELIKVLNQVIKDMEHQYFDKLSQTVFDKVNSSSIKLNRLHDPSFVDFFNQLCQEKQVIEYYLVDEQGSFLLIDNKGTPYWLAIADNSELEGFYETAVTEKAPELICEVLKNKTKMPVFFTEDGLWTHPIEWKPYLYPIKRLDGLDTYYYALIENPTSDQWLPKQVISYKNYLRQAC